MAARTPKKAPAKKTQTRRKEPTKKATTAKAAPKKPATKKPAAAKPTRAPKQDAALTEREDTFAREYIVDLNATRAAIRAGLSEKTARQAGARMLSKVNVQQRIAELMEARNDRVDASADWMLKRLMEEANADLADLYDDNGDLKPIKDWPRIWRMGLVAGIETEVTRIKGDSGTGQWKGPAQDVHDEDGGAEVVIRKLKLSDRTKRLDMIGKHVDVQAFKERRTLEADDSLQQLARQIGGNAIRPAPDAGKPS